MTGGLRGSGPQTLLRAQNSQTGGAALSARGLVTRECPPAVPLEPSSSPSPGGSPPGLQGFLPPCAGRGGSSGFQGVLVRPLLWRISGASASLNALPVPLLPAALAGRSGSTSLVSLLSDHSAALLFCSSPIIRQLLFTSLFSNSWSSTVEQRVTSYAIVADGDLVHRPVPGGLHRNPRAGAGARASPGPQVVPTCSAFEKQGFTGGGRASTPQPPENCLGHSTDPPPRAPTQQVRQGTQAVLKHNQVTQQTWGAPSFTSFPSSAERA